MKNQKSENSSSGSISVLAMEGVSLFYGSTVAVKDLTLEVKKGEILVVLGPSGCGKTSCLRLAAGLERPAKGKIFIAGRQVAGNGIWVPPEKRGVGIVFQDYALFPHLTVAENIAFGLKKASREQKLDRIEEILSLVGLQDLGQRYPHQLSGGQQQRVALGRSLAPQPQLLLMDEPFSNLDTDLRIHVREEVRHILKSTVSTALFVTHDQEEAFSIGDRLAVLNGGRLEQHDRPEVLFHEPLTRFVADFVGHADFIPGIVKGAQIQTELGFFPLPRSREELREGIAVEIMVRPDHIHLSSSPEGPGLIVEKRFLGSFNQYDIRLPSGNALHAYSSSSVFYAEGTRVNIKLEEEDLIVFPAEAKTYSTGSSKPNYIRM